MPRVDEILAHDGIWVCGNGHDMTIESNWYDYVDELGNEMVRCRQCKLVGDRRSRARRKVKGQYKRDDVRTLSIADCRAIVRTDNATITVSDYLDAATMSGLIPSAP